MKKHEIHAAMLENIRLQDEIAIKYDFPGLIAYNRKYHAEYYKPREPAQTGTIRNNPEQKDLAYQIGKAIARIIRRVLK